MMTEAQKKMIAKMCDLGAGYTEVAKQLDLPVGTIKTYCRRNGLTSDRRDTQLQKKSRNARKNDLIDVENRGNSTATIFIPFARRWLMTAWKVPAPC